MVIATAEGFAGIDEIEAADGGDMDLALLLKLDEGEDFLHQRSACILALGKWLARHGHGEAFARRQHYPFYVLADFVDAPRGGRDLALGVMQLPANGEEIVVMGGAQPFQSRDIGFKTCDFKCLNDTLGHAEGDRCLVKVAGIVQSCMRNDLDYVARFGGEEFLVFLPGCDETTASEIAERIRSRVEAASLRNPAARAAPFVTLSIGVAAVNPRDAEISADELQKMADARLYLAKDGGRNRVATDQPE
ncbi:GGDEF domain-containing protein [Agrobacterium deltaense]|nr:GGDEF domain-containing protein [Agrobacterium deltaense]